MVEVIITLADYDISSAYYSQKTSYVPVQGDPDDTLPNYGDDKTKATSLKGSDKIERDWYEKVVKKRTIANKKYNSSENENWGSSAPIDFGVKTVCIFKKRGLYLQVNLWMQHYKLTVH